MKERSRAGDVICSHCGEVTAGTVHRYFLESPREVFAHGDVIDLAHAVRRGDRDAAEHLLDRLLGDDEIVRDWMDQGRALA